MNPTEHQTFAPILSHSSKRSAFAFKSSSWQAVRMAFLTSLFSITLLTAQGEAPPVDSGYRVENIPLPPGESLELVSISLMPEDQICVTTRRGDVWVGTGIYDEDLSEVSWNLFARGLREGFGSFYRDGAIHVLQKGELTRLLDTTGDDKADTFVTVNDDWGLGHNIHDFAFGSAPDANGDVWVTLCLTGSSRSETPFRGWAIQITPEGEMIPTVSGLRSPGGVGFDAQGTAFYTDNQGHWNGSSCVKPLLPGTFVGNPSSLKWYDQAPEVGKAPAEPVSESRIEIERQRIPEFMPPAVVFPHGTIGQSPTGIISDLSGGKFGPFQDQMFVGEITHSQVQRVMMEQVKGVYQGAVVNFLSGIDFGVVPVTMNQEKGVMLLGGTNRGWGSRGEQSFGLARVVWSGEQPFALEDIKVTEEGFCLQFTKPLEESSMGDLSVDSFGYIYQSGYGSPVVDEAEHAILKSELSEDGMTLELAVANRAAGSIHQLAISEFKSTDGGSLTHGDVFYTLHEVPGEDLPDKNTWEGKKAGFTGKPNDLEKESLLSSLPDPSVKPEKPRRILCFYRCERVAHGSIPYANHALKVMGEELGTFAVDFEDEYEVFTAERLAAYDAVILNNTTGLQLSDEQKQAFLDFVEGGKGVVGIHAASDNFKDWDDGCAMIGGVFNGHPWGSGGTWAFKVEDPKHPINRAFGGRGVYLQDEIYWYRPESFQGREKLRVLLSLDMSKRENQEVFDSGKFKDKLEGDPAALDIPVSWCRAQGDGRVFYTNLGHRHATFLNRQCLQHLLDGIQYAIGDLKASDIPSAMAKDGIEVVLAPERVIPESIEQVYELFPNVLTNRDQWKVTASHNEKDLPKLIDGNRGSRYTTRARQEKGMWVQIEFPEETEVQGVLMESLGSDSDFPPKYRVQVSDDGESWNRTVASPEGSAWSEVVFPVVKTRFLRLYLLTPKGGFWSIHELEVLGVE